jgi:hypothetical protein
MVTVLISLSTSSTSQWGIYVEREQQERKANDMLEQPNRKLDVLLLRRHDQDLSERRKEDL